MPVVKSKIMSELQSAGNACASVCFALAQGADMISVEHLRDSYQKWDAAKEHLAEWYARKSKE